MNKKTKTALIFFILMAIAMSRNQTEGDYIFVLIYAALAAVSAYQFIWGDEL